MMTDEFEIDEDLALLPQEPEADDVIAYWRTRLDVLTGRRPPDVVWSVIEAELVLVSRFLSGFDDMGDAIARFLAGDRDRFEVIVEHCDGVGLDELSLEDVVWLHDLEEWPAEAIALAHLVCCVGVMGIGTDRPAFMVPDDAETGGFTWQPDASI